MKTRLIPLFVTLGLILGACSQQVSQLSDAAMARITYPFRVSDESYFVLGDNTMDALDSRFWGALPRENILGRVMGK
jgi:type IV secretory pathway protease TraF